MEVVHADASRFPLEPGSYDVAFCLGASFVWSGLEATLAALRPAVRQEGYVAVGEPYWRTWPPPHDIEDGGYVSLAETAARVERAGLRLVGLIAASEDDWDRYESLHWRAIEEWLAENPDDPGAQPVRHQHDEFRGQYLRWQRAGLGWAIFVGWRAWGKPGFPHGHPS